MKTTVLTLLDTGKLTVISGLSIIIEVAQINKILTLLVLLTAFLLNITKLFKDKDKNE